ncbi:probable serine/threonine-protein kinase DDB_G0282963 [Condylostylus longicornis]|uniref:probable serine/threonine-protein kinase DDB_G0282963 n=1 Tax=Condylostylus longicornis TaxID=2530218 RepID=UPI00244E5331|nr:probable serine/threonine-protein kinase DDB_G0282963 [Condylostylus longicornis]
MAHELNSILKRDIECTTNNFKIINYKPTTAIKLEHSTFDNQNLSKNNNNNINLIKREIESDNNNCNSISSNNMLVTTPSMNHSFKKLNNNNYNINNNNNNTDTNLMLLTSSSSLVSSAISNTKQSIIDNPSAITSSVKYFTNNINNSNKAIKSSSNTTNSTTTSATGSTKMGSRRIFTPQFKLQVLDSYRNDSDCKGNQRATARKYGIHRRQIQKWLQCESNLRSSVANLNNQNNIKHQFHNISHNNTNNSNNNKTNSNIGKIQSNLSNVTSATVTTNSNTAAAAAAAAATAAAAAAEAAHHHKLPNETPRHHGVISLMRPIPLQHDKNTSNNMIPTVCANNGTNMSPFLTHHQTPFNQHRHSINSNALSNILPPTTTTTMVVPVATAATISSGFIPTPPQPTNIRSSNNLLNLNSHSSDIPIIATKSNQSHIMYNVPTLQPYTATATINSLDQQNRISNLIAAPNCNSNNTYTPDNSIVSTATTVAPTITTSPSSIAPLGAVAATKSGTYAVNDQNVNVSVPIPILPTPRHPPPPPSLHSHTIHHLNHSQHYSYHYQYLQQQIPSVNSQLPIQLHNHTIAVQHNNHHENRMYVPPSVSLPINSSSDINSTNTTNSVGETTERQCITHQQITPQNNAHSLSLYEYNDMKENSTGNAISTYDYQIGNREQIITTVKLEEQSIQRSSSPIDLSIGNKRRLDDQKQLSEESEEIQIDVCEDEVDDNKDLVEIKSSNLNKITCNDQTNDNSVVDLSCRKRKLSDNDFENIEKPPEKQQKLDQKTENPKPVKLFKPYLLDNENEKDNNNTENISSTTKNEKVDRNPVIWSHYQSEYDLHNDEIVNNNFLQDSNSHNSSNAQINSDYHYMTGSPNFQNQSSLTLLTSSCSSSTINHNNNNTNNPHTITPLSDSCRSTIISSGVLSPRSPNGFWNCPKGSPVSGYETASIYSDCSDYHNSNTYNNNIHNNNVTNNTGNNNNSTLSGTNNVISNNNSNELHQNITDTSVVTLSTNSNNNNNNVNNNEESKIISFKRNHIQRWLEHDSESDNGRQGITLYS